MMDPNPQPKSSGTSTLDNATPPQQQIPIDQQSLTFAGAQPEDIRNMQYDTEFPTFREKLQDLITTGFLNATHWTKINMDFGIKLRPQLAPPHNFNFMNFYYFSISYLEEIGNPYDPMFEILKEEIEENLLRYMYTKFRTHIADNHILTQQHNGGPSYINNISASNFSNDMIKGGAWTTNDAYYFHMQRTYISFIYRAFFYILSFVVGRNILPQSIITSLDILIAFTNTLSDFTYLIREKDLILGLITYFKCYWQKLNGRWVVASSGRNEEKLMNSDDFGEDFEYLYNMNSIFFNFNEWFFGVVPDSPMVKFLSLVKQSAEGSRHIINISDIFLAAMNENIFPNTMLDIDRHWLLSKSFIDVWEDTSAEQLSGAEYKLDPSEKENINISFFLIESLMKYSNDVLRSRWVHFNYLAVAAQQGGVEWPLLLQSGDDDNDVKMDIGGEDGGGGGGGGGAGGGGGNTLGTGSSIDIQKGGQYGVMLQDKGGHIRQSTFLVEVVSGKIHGRTGKVYVKYRTPLGGIATTWVNPSHLVAPSAILSASHQRAERYRHRFQQSVDKATAAVERMSVLYARDTARVRHGLPHGQFSGVLDFINTVHQRANDGFRALRDQQGKPLPLRSNDPYCAICWNKGGYRVRLSVHPKNMGGGLQGGGKRKGKKKKSKRKKRRKRKRSRRPKKRRHKKTIKKRRKKKKTRRKK